MPDGTDFGEIVSTFFVVTGDEGPVEAFLAFDCVRVDFSSEARAFRFAGTRDAGFFALSWFATFLTVLKSSTAGVTGLD